MSRDDIQLILDRLDQIEKRVEKRFDRIEAHLRQHDNQFEAIYRRLDKIDTGLRNRGIHIET